MEAVAGAGGAEASAKVRRRVNTGLQSSLVSPSTLRTEQLLQTKYKLMFAHSEDIKKCRLLIMILGLKNKTSP